MSPLRRHIVLVLALFLAACREGAAPAANQAAHAAPAPAPPRRIALVMKSLTNPFFIEMEKGARNAERQFGVALQVRTGAQETAIEQQIQIIDELIAAKVDALVVAPGDSQRLVPVLKKAQAAGIVIINIDNRLDPALLARAQMAPVPFVGVDNEAAAYQSARYIAEQARRPAQAVIIEGIRSAENGQLRLRGAERAFHDNPKIKLVAKETANWKIDEANALAERLFARHPEIGLVFCANDMMAIGVLKYLQDSGRKHVLVAGYDALDEAKAAIREGAMAATVDQQAAQQGYQGVALAVRALKGERLPPLTTVETHLVTAATLK